MLRLNGYAFNMYLAFFGDVESRHRLPDLIAPSSCLRVPRRIADGDGGGVDAQPIPTRGPAIRLVDDGDVRRGRNPAPVVVLLIKGVDNDRWLKQAGLITGPEAKRKISLGCTPERAPDL